MPTVLILAAAYAGLAEPWPVIVMTRLAMGCAAFLISLGLPTVEIRNRALRAETPCCP